MERADLDPGVHVILVSGRGEGFCAGFDLCAYAERIVVGRRRPARITDTVLSGKTQAVNHLPDQPWDPMIDYQMMSRFVRGFSSLMHADKPTVVKIHGYCVAGRHRHRAARRPGDRRRRRQDRLPADAGVGRAGRGPVGAPARRPARETPSVHR